MNSTVTYHKKKNFPKKKLMRVVGILMILGGLGLSGYIFSPLLLWEVFLAPHITTEALVTPIPQRDYISEAKLSDFFSASAHTGGGDLTRASNWYPGLTQSPTTNVPTFTLDIPKLKIVKAVVSTTDDDLAKHLVNYSGTCTPPQKGNCVIFGHSTLPQLYQAGNYKTIFANILNLSIGDTVTVHVADADYTYKIFSIIVVDPDNTSVLEQTLDDSYITIITCTPPGTLWKRLVIKARLQPL